MHEEWLQRYIKSHYLEIGFTEIHGPYPKGADFKGVYAGKRIKIEAEWDYSDYILHQHPPRFADILVVATLKPVPHNLQSSLPAIIIKLDRKIVVEWAKPLRINKNREDYHGYAWRRLSKSLLDLYTCSRLETKQSLDFTGSKNALPRYKSQTPAGFLFGTGGKELTYEGNEQDKAAWDYWLIVAHSVASQFKLKPSFLRPTWIDRTALLYNYTGKVTSADIEKLKEVSLFIDELFARGEL